jgi:hypothetical protein
MGKRTNVYKILLENPRKRHNTESIGVDGIIILKTDITEVCL